MRWRWCIGPGCRARAPHAHGVWPEEVPPFSGAPNTASTLPAATSPAACASGLSVAATANGLAPRTATTQALLAVAAVAEFAAASPLGPTSSLASPPRPKGAAT